MTTRSRAVLLIAAAVVLVAAFVIARGLGEDGNVATAPTTQIGTTGSGGTGGAQAPAGEPEATPAPRVETIRLEGGENATGDVQQLAFEKGDTVRLRFTSDEAVEVHLHGYDKTLEVPAGGSQRMVFEADAEGVFEIENEGAGIELARLEVRP